MTVAPNTLGDEREAIVENAESVPLKFDDRGGISIELAVGKLHTVLQSIISDAKIIPRTLGNLTYYVDNIPVNIGNRLVDLKHLEKVHALIQNKELLGCIERGRGFVNAREIIILSDKAAQVLGDCTSVVLRLEGLISLTDTQAMYLSRFKGTHIILNGLTELSDKQAEKLGQFRGEELALNGIRTLSRKQAFGLAQFPGILRLNGISALTDDIATEFGKTAAKRIYLLNVQCITRSQALMIRPISQQILLSPGAWPDYQNHA